MPARGRGWAWTPLSVPRWTFKSIMWIFLESFQRHWNYCTSAICPYLFSKNGDWNSYCLCYYRVPFSKGSLGNGPQTEWCFLESCVGHSWPVLLWDGNAAVMPLLCCLHYVFIYPLALHSQFLTRTWVTRLFRSLQSFKPPPSRTIHSEPGSFSRQGGHFTPQGWCWGLFCDLHYTSVG